jgi:hypothetical protein
VDLSGEQNKRCKEGVLLSRCICQQFCALTHFLLKAQLPSLPAHFDGSVSADYMFDQVLEKVRLAYERCPAYSTQSADTRPIFERCVCAYTSYYIFQYSQNCRNNVVFAVLKGSTVNLVEEKYFRGTAGEFFGQLKSNKLISETDVKNHKVALRLFVYSRDLAYTEVACSTLMTSLPMILILPTA